MTMLQDIEAAASLDDLYPLFEHRRFTAGWHKKRRSLWKEPATAYRPRHWSYAEARAALERASAWIDTEQAERRNLLMFNPIEDNDYDTVATLVAAYQLIQPGEHARAHRHSPNALRLVLDAPEGLFTVVDGVKLPMCPGDVLLTPGGRWHSHFHLGSGSACWIDILDVPLVHRLEPMFYEDHPDTFQPVLETPEAHPFWFKRAEIDAALAGAEADACGVRRHVLDSRPHLPTMELSCLSLPAGSGLGPRRDTASRIYAVVSGSGSFRSEAGDLRWQRGDVFAAPAWARHEIEAETASELFEASDMPVMTALGFYRSE